MTFKVCVTAQSFVKSEQLRGLLESELPSADIYYHFAEESFQDFLIKHQPHAWVVGREPVNKDVLEVLNELEVVSKYGVGIDNVATEDLQNLGVDFYCEMGVNSQSVAEFTLGLMLGLSRNVCRASSLLSHGIWKKDGGRNLSGSKVGIIGCGNIGSKVARLTSAFACDLYINDIVDKTDFCQKNNFSFVGLDELLQKSDFVTLHVPLTRKTHGFIDLSRLRLIGDKGYLINTSRGEVVVQDHLKKALKNSYLAGAALDVYDGEPLTDSELYENPRFIGTPHIAGNSREAVLSMGKAAIRGVVQKFESH